MKRLCLLSAATLSLALIAIPHSHSSANDTNEHVATASGVPGGENSGVDHAVGDSAHVNWSLDQIRRDPEGYFECVIAHLQAELAAITPQIEELELSVDELTVKIDENMVALNNTRTVAKDFRRHYQKAKKENRWPVEICGKDYSEERLESQICRLAVRAEAFKAAIEQLREARERAEAGLEEAESRPTQLETEVIITQMTRRLYRAQQIPSSGPAMIERMTSLLADPKNKCNPDELLRALTDCRPIKEIEGRRRTIARQFLGTRGLAEKTKSKPKQQAQTEAATPIFLQK